MYKKLQRLTSFLLAIAMLISLSPTVFAESENKSSDSTPTTAIYYIANSTNGGSDIRGDGSKSNPFLTLSKAIQDAEDADADEVKIILLSDINLTQELIINTKLPVSITTEDDTRCHTLQYTGTTSIGLSSGIIKIANNTTVTFDRVHLSGSADTEGRVLYLSPNASATLQHLTVSNGRTLNALENTSGGSGIFVGDQTKLIVDTCVFRNNDTNANGGAIYVADGGAATISNTEFVANTAMSGGAVYADTQSHNYGGSTLSNVTIHENTAIVGGGMYLCPDSNVSISGTNQINLNKSGNVYLPEGATLHLSDATDGKIGITAEDEAAYRLVALPCNNYTIQPTVSGDESALFDDCGNWDIRYMNYNGIPGLYLYPKTLDLCFTDVTTLTSVKGTDINGEAVDFLNAPIPGSTNITGTLTVPAVATKGKELSITFTCDPAEYRLPTKDVISVKSDSKDIAFAYTPYFETGTAVITIDAAIVGTLTQPIVFQISAEKYYNLTIDMNGPLYTMETDITGLQENVLDVTSSAGDTVISYTVKCANSPVSDVVIALYAEDTDALAASVTTGADGIASFSNLDTSKSYYPILKYQNTYRIISRDTVDLKLSTLDGQTLSASYVSDPAMPISYDSFSGDAAISNITADTTVTFSLADPRKDTITFIANDSSATSAPATLSMASKDMAAGATTYGTLPTASLEGYNFDGWYSAPVGGIKITSTTAYSTTSTHILYAHWIAKTNTAYKIRHWVEYAASGINVGFESVVAETVEYNGRTYYLYETKNYADGISDTLKDISTLDLAVMSDSIRTWWTRAGFTATYQKDCSVLANGTSVFNIYYDRNSYEISFATPVEAGTSSNADVIPVQSVDFGTQIGTLPTPTLPGYSFVGWYDTTQPVTADTIYQKSEATKLTARWSAKTDTKWAIKIAVQDIQCDEKGIYRASNTWSEYKTIFKDNSGSLLIGTTDTAVNLNVSDITELSLPGFNYAGYAATYQKTSPAFIESSAAASVYIKPTDATTENADGKYNEEFDGSILWLYYTRKTAIVSFPNAETPDPDDNWSDNSEIIYGGNFTGKLPLDPGKDGYDFIGWLDGENNSVKAETLTDHYIENADTLILHPSWRARTYQLTYVPGSNADFVTTDGSDPQNAPDLDGGYVDPKQITYDQSIGVMPRAVKSGYTFDGWFLNDRQITENTVATIENIIVSNAPTYTHETTRPLYAKYTPHTYTLRFCAGTGASVSQNEMRISFDSPVGTLPTPTLSGYRFVGWYLDLNDASSLLRSGDIWRTAYANGQTINLYANWIPNTYQYTFNLNDATAGKGSTFGMLRDLSIDHTDETYGSVYDGIFQVEATRPGYIFSGWALDADATEEDVLTANDLVSISQNTTVYAVWTPKEYTVKFSPGGAEMPRDFIAQNPSATLDVNGDWSIKVKFDTSFGVLPVPEKTNYSYQGWRCSAPHWSAINNQVVTVLPSYIDHADADGITLSAIMLPQNAGGGGNAGDDAISYTITATSDTGATITPAGEISVRPGATQTFTFSAKSGYILTDVFVDGKRVDVQCEYAFTDVNENHSIEIKTASMLTREHIAYIIGSTDGLVHPEADITRAEVAMIFYRLLTEDARAQYEAARCSYPDVSDTAWYSAAVATLSNMGIITGAPDGNFYPMRNITRAELATIAARFDDGSIYIGADQFSDIDHHWAADYINRAADRGWVNGVGDGSFQPDRPITRAEVMVLVNRVLGRASITEGSLLDGMIEWPDNAKPSKWYYLAVQEATNGHHHTSTDNTEVWTTLI